MCYAGCITDRPTAGPTRYGPTNDGLHASLRKSRCWAQSFIHFVQITAAAPTQIYNFQNNVCSSFYWLAKYITKIKLNAFTEGVTFSTIFYLRRFKLSLKWNLFFIIFLKCNTAKSHKCLTGKEVKVCWIFPLKVK